MDKIANILGLIVIVALVAVVVGGKNSASVIKNLGDAFAGSIRAATGIADGSQK